MFDMSIRSKSQRFNLLILNRIIPWMFLKGYWQYYHYYRWCEVIHGRCKSSSTFCPYQLSYTQRHRLLDIIPGPKCLLMQNILFNLHVAPNLINHCSTFSNLLILDSSGEAEMARTEQTAYLFCVVFTLRCQGHQALADTKYDLLNQGKCCDHNNKSPHHQFREFELQICQCPKI